MTREVPVAVPLPDLRPAAGQPRAGTAGANEQRIAEKKEAAKNRMRAKRKRDQDEKLAEHFEMDIDDVTELGADDRSAKVAAHNAWKDRAQWNKRLAAFSGRTIDEVDRLTEAQRALLIKDKHRCRISKENRKAYLQRPGHGHR